MSIPPSKASNIVIAKRMREHTLAVHGNEIFEFQPLSLSYFIKTETVHFEAMKTKIRAQMMP